MSALTTCGRGVGRVVVENRSTWAVLGGSAWTIRFSASPPGMVGPRRTVDQELRGISQQEQRVADASATAHSNASAEALVRKLNELASQRERRQRERLTAQNQAAARDAARQGFGQLREQFLHILENVDSLNYDGKRDVLERLGMHVEVRRREPGTHRLIITADPNRDASARANNLMAERTASSSGNDSLPEKGGTLLSTVRDGRFPVIPRQSSPIARARPPSARGR